MENQTEVYKMASANLHGFGKSKLEVLMTRIKSLKDVFELNHNELEKETGISSGIFQRMKRAHALDQGFKNMEFNHIHGIRSLFFTEKSYPYQLKECKDAPIHLNLLGEINIRDQKIIAIVGTRKCSTQSQYIVDRFISELKGSDIVVVSGLAAGIDTHVHESCLKHKVKTLAVLGHGLNMIYPQHNRTLAKNIVEEGGGLLTEFNFEERPNKYTFPQRNRIIAGISDATIVIESPLKGGAMITAELANGYSREVMAFPNSILNEQLAGCNALVKKNQASLITEAKDLFELMNWNPGIRLLKESSIELSSEEHALMEIIGASNSLHIDEIIKVSELKVSKIPALLLQLELKDLIFSQPGLFYVPRH